MSMFQVLNDPEVFSKKNICKETHIKETRINI